MFVLDEDELALYAPMRGGISLESFFWIEAVSDASARLVPASAAPRTIAGS